MNFKYACCCPKEACNIYQECLTMLLLNKGHTVTSCFSLQTMVLNHRRSFVLHIGSKRKLTCLICRIYEWTDWNMNRPLLKLYCLFSLCSERVHRHFLSLSHTRPQRLNYSYKICSKLSTPYKSRIAMSHVWNANTQENINVNTK